MSRPWVVSIISTDYDLHDLRVTLIDCVSGCGFKVLAFEEASFPVKPGVHSHDACLEALKSADIVILLIDKRYGGNYILNDAISITEAEYDAACAQNKIIIPCVRQKTWDECHALKTLIKGAKETEGEFRNTHKPISIEGWQVYDFVQKVTHARSNNFTVFYTDPRDIIANVKGKLTGISNYLIETLVGHLVRDVQSTKTTTALSLSIGDVLTKGYFIDPPYEILSGDHSAASEGKISDIIFDSVINDKSVALLGQPGIGKSTLLAKAFLEHAKKFFSNDEGLAPIHIKLRGLGSGFSFDVNDVITTLMTQHFNKDPYPMLDLSLSRFTFYIDAFDELTENVSDINVDEIMSKSLFEWSFAITARLRFANYYLEVSTFGDKLNLVVQLQSWSENIAKQYIEQFCVSRGRSDLSGQLRDYLSKGEMLETIFVNPLLLTLFLLIVEEGAMEIPLDVVDKLSLYKRAIYVLSRRESSKLPILYRNNTFANKIASGWKVTAWEIFQCRIDQVHLTVDDLPRKVKGIFSESELQIVSNQLTSLLDIAPHTDRVRGFVHEELLEFLVASSILDGLIAQQHPFPESLKYTVRSEINKFIISLFRKLDPEEKNKILSALEHQFRSYLGSESSDAVTIRNQAAYYIGRLETQEAKDCLIALDKAESNIAVKLSLAFGLVKGGFLDKEEELYTQLSNNADWDRANRGYHLLYYRDCMSHEQLPFFDPQNIPWGKTLKALFSHLISPSLRHLYLCRVEMFTLNRYIETRETVGNLSMEMLDQIQLNLKSLEKSVSPSFYDKATLVYNSLEETWRRYAGSK